MISYVIMTKINCLLHIKGMNEDTLLVNMMRRVVGGGVRLKS